MTDHGGFAAAVTVREDVLRIALLAAYANGSFPKSLNADLPGGPPDVKSELFLGMPQVDCEGATNLLVLTLRAWGLLRLTGADQVEHVAQLAGELEVTVKPVFGPGQSVQLEASGDDIVARRWTATVISADTADVAAYVAGDQLRDRLQEAIRIAVAFRQISLPSIDVSFFGPLARLATSIGARVRNGALLLGLNVDNDEVTIVGDPTTLADFARGNDVAGVVNPLAVGLMLAEVHDKLQAGIEDEGAHLTGFAVSPANGYFQVSGAASKSSGTVNFTFRVVPQMYHTRPGAYFRFLPKTRWVNSHTWPALAFHIEGVDTDVDRSWWVVVLDVFLGVLTVGLATIYIEELVSAAGQDFSAQVRAAPPGAPAARVRRTIPPPGGVGVRIGVDQFEITPVGSYVGISVRATPTPAALLGPTVVPRTYTGDVLRYVLRLPSGVSADDPALRVRWTLEDRTNDDVLADEDGPVAGRLRFDFSPWASGNATEFRLVARLYRRLGSQVTELGIESLPVQLRGPLPARAYVRWRSGARNPQITVDEATDTWTYRGEAPVLRWSEWHRTDAPCRSVNVFAHRFDIEFADRLPFPLRLLENHRKGLCPYCFYGGPAGVNPRL